MGFNSGFKGLTPFSAKNSICWCVVAAHPQAATSKDSTGHVRDLQA